MIKSRREFLKLGAGTAVSLGALLSPAWLKPARIALEATPAARRDRILAPSVAAATPSPPDPSGLRPLGPVQGTDGRPLSYNMDSGRIASVGSVTATLQTGRGVRLLRLSPDSTVWFEGNEKPYTDGSAVVGDYAVASGTALEDMSLSTRVLTLNALVNQLGAISQPSGFTLPVFLRRGKGRGSWDATPTVWHITPKTKFYRGRGNFDNPNSSLADAKAGGAVVIDGYLTRQGERYALQVYYGSQFPLPDTPSWLLEKVAQP